MLKPFALWGLVVLAEPVSAKPSQIKAHFGATHLQVDAFSFSMAGQEWTIHLQKDHRVSVRTRGSTRFVAPVRLSEPMDPDQIQHWVEFSPSEKRLWNSAVQSKDSRAEFLWPEGHLHDDNPDWAWATISLPFVSNGFGAYPTLILAVHRPSGAWRIAEIEEIETGETTLAGGSLHIAFTGPGYDRENAKIAVPAWIAFSFNGQTVAIQKSNAAR